MCPLKYKVFTFDKSNLFIFFTYAGTSVMISKRHCLIQGHENLRLFSSQSLIVLALALKSLVYFELFLIWYEVGVQFHFFISGHPVVPALYVVKTTLSPIKLSWHL